MGIINKIVLGMAAVLIAGSLIVMAKDRYEDYRKERDKYNNRTYREKRDKPLSELDANGGNDLAEDLRNAVRDEIDDTIRNKKKEEKKNINEDELIKQVRTIVREEIEDAIKVKEKRYLARGTVEAGGFLSFQSKGLEGNEDDNNYILKVYPMANYFLTNNVALGIKGEAEFNLTADTRSYNVGAGPQFVFGVNKNDDICFYTALFAGISKNYQNNDYGWRYGNELGFKFVLTSGVILNAGCMIVFDTNGQQERGFQNILVPTIGITAWF